MQTNKGSATIILLVVVVVVAAAVLVYFAFLKKSGEVAVSPTPTATPTKTATPTPDETAGWKTYSNNQYGFEFKYPQNWRMVTYTPSSSSGIIVSFFDDNTAKLGVSYWKDIHNENVTGGSYSGQPTYKNLDDLMNDKSGEAMTFQVSKITLLGGQRAYKVIIGGAGANDGMMVENDGIYQLVFNDIIYGKDPNGHPDNTGDLIISTFKFTNSTPDNETADWLPFKSSFFTLSFKIPSGFEVKEGQNYILVAKSLYYTTDIGSDNAFFRLTRYNSNDTRESRLASYRKLLKNVQESTVAADGSLFLVLKGDDWGRFEGDSAGKVVVVLFDASWLEIIERPTNSDQSFNPITIGDQILSTFKFTK